MVNPPQSDCNPPYPFSSTLSAALWLASLGWLVLPLHTPAGTSCSCGRSGCRSSGKHPRTRNGISDATTVLETIRQWWAMWNDANLGVVTGAASGTFVLDVDPRHGGDEALAGLTTRFGSLPVTPQVTTGGGGAHYYFAWPTFMVPNSVGRVGKGLDVKGQGGLVNAPPSLHLSGRTHTWVDGRRPDQLELVQAPSWLLNLVRQPNGPNREARTVQRRSVVRQGVAEGARNASVASLAGYLFRNNVDPHVVLDLLQPWNSVRNNPPLSAEEVARTVNSIASRDLARRRGGSHE